MFDPYSLLNYYSLQVIKLLFIVDVGVLLAYVLFTFVFQRLIFNEDIYDDMADYTNIDPHSHEMISLLIMFSSIIVLVVAFSLKYVDFTFSPYYTPSVFRILLIIGVGALLLSILIGLFYNVFFTDNEKTALIFSLAFFAIFFTGGGLSILHPEWFSFEGDRETVSKSIAEVPISRGLSIEEVEEDRGKRWALCIGINDYEDSTIYDLDKSVADARVIGSTLEKNGQFDRVVVMTSTEDPRAENYPRLRNIRKKLNVLTQSIEPNDMVFFSFSGHGVSDGSGVNYLTAVDTESEALFETSLPVKEITEWFEELEVSKSLLVVDACREQIQRSKSLDLKSLNETAYRHADLSAVFFSTKEGNYSYEDPNTDYGVFTRYIVEGMKGAADLQDFGGNSDGIISFFELADYVENQVISWSLAHNKNQIPYTRINGEKFGDLALSTYDRKRKEDIERLVVGHPTGKSEASAQNDADFSESISEKPSFFSPFLDPDFSEEDKKLRNKYANMVRLVVKGKYKEADKVLESVSLDYPRYSSFLREFEERYIRGELDRLKQWDYYIEPTLMEKIGLKILSFGKTHVCYGTVDREDKTIVFSDRFGIDKIYPAPDKEHVLVASSYNAYIVDNNGENLVKIDNKIESILEKTFNRYFSEPESESYFWIDYNTIGFEIRGNRGGYYQIDIDEYNRLNRLRKY